jgi:nicotinamidase-related amidase
LEAVLRASGETELVIFGASTNSSVETTVRHAASLGFQVTIVEDACFAFNKRDYRGVERTADEVHAMSLANLAGEYARIVTAEDVLQSRERQ